MERVTNRQAALLADLGYSFKEYVFLDDNNNLFEKYGEEYGIKCFLTNNDLTEGIVVPLVINAVEWFRIRHDIHIRVPLELLNDDIEYNDYLRELITIELLKLKTKLGLENAGKSEEEMIAEVEVPPMPDYDYAEEVPDPIEDELMERVIEDHENAEESDTFMDSVMKVGKASYEEVEAATPNTFSYDTLTEEKFIEIANKLIDKHDK